jgi:hypothetical protein
MQDDSDYKKSYDYFVKFIREALRAGIPLDAFTKEKIRQIVHDEVKLLLNANLNDGSNFSFPISPVFSNAFSGNIGWLKSNQALLTLYNKLISYGYLVTDFQQLKSHFIGTTTIEIRLIWFGQINQLTYLFDQLRTNGIIPDSKHPHQLLKKHFLNPKGRELKGEILRSSLNQVRSGVRIREIDEIIMAIEKSD